MRLGWCAFSFPLPLDANQLALRCISANESGPGPFFILLLLLVVVVVVVVVLCCDTVIGKFTLASWQRLLSTKIERLDCQMVKGQMVQKTESTPNPEPPSLPPSLSLSTKREERREEKHHPILSLPSFLDGTVNPNRPRFAGRKSCETRIRE